METARQVADLTNKMLDLRDLINEMFEGDTEDLLDSLPDYLTDKPNATKEELDSLLWEWAMQSDGTGELHLNHNYFDDAVAEALTGRFRQAALSFVAKFRKSKDQMPSDIREGVAELLGVDVNAAEAPATFGKAAEAVLDAFIPSDEEVREALEMGEDHLILIGSQGYEEPQVSARMAKQIKDSHWLISPFDDYSGELLTADILAANLPRGISTPKALARKIQNAWCVREALFIPQMIRGLSIESGTGFYIAVPVENVGIVRAETEAV